MSAEPPQLPPKPDVALALLQTAASVFVHLDPRGADVLVPAWFKKQPQLVLQIGLNMTVPIPDLDVTSEGITCTLSFNRSPQFCRIPWASIYGLVGEDGRGMIWPDSVPKEVAASADGRAQAAQAEKAKRGKLRLASEADVAAPEAEGAGAQEGKADTQATVAPAVARKGRKKGEARAPSKKVGAVSAATSANRKASEARTEAAGRPKASRANKAREGNAAASEGSASSPASKGRDLPKTPAVRPPAGAVIEPARNPPGGAPAAPAGRAPVAPPGKARRELPPYLRIVK
jgi:hypothetical protein